MPAVTTGISATLTIIVAAYALGAFIATLKSPRLGFALLIPIIGLGFEETALLKGGIIALVMIGTLIHALATGKRFMIPSSILGLLLTLFALMAWVFVRVALTGDEFTYWVEWVAKRLFIPGMLVPLAVFTLRDEQAVMRAGRVLLGFGVITALFGIVQYFVSDGFFWQAREVLGVPGPIAYQIVDRIRISGLSSYVVPLAYQLGSLTPIALAVFFMRSSASRRTLAFATLIIIAAGLVLTLLKSAIGGAFLGAAIVFVIAYRRGYLKPWSPVPALVVLALMVGVVASHSGIREQVFAFGSPTLERIPITLSAVNIVVDHPLGVGYEFPEYVRESYADVAHYLGASVVVHHFPHNIILNLAAILGLPALVLAIVFYFILFNSLGRVRDGGGRLNLLAIGLTGSFAAYIVNALFHNNSPFFGDTFNWLIIGIAAAAIRTAIVSRKQALLE